MALAIVFPQRLATSIVVDVETVIKKMPHHTKITARDQEHYFQKGLLKFCALVSYNAGSDGMVFWKCKRCKNGKTGGEHTLVQGCKLFRKPVPNSPAFQPTLAAPPAEPAPADFHPPLAEQGIELPPGLEGIPNSPLEKLEVKLEAAAEAAEPEAKVAVKLEPIELPAQSPIKEKEARISHDSTPPFKTTVLPNFNLKSVVKKLIETHTAVERAKLILGLHERFWHA